MTRLDLELATPAGRTPLAFEVRRMLNAGYVGRDQEAVRHHIDELAREGVAPPPSIPMLFPMLVGSVTTAGRIETVEEKTSGEIEFVLLLQGGRTYVGIGSDHTDRPLEAVDMLKSKQACPNVLGRVVWDYADVRDHWDRLQMQSWVRPAPNAEWLPYQSASVAAILSPEQILDLARARVADHRLEQAVIFSGTIPVKDGRMIYGTAFRCELEDPVLRRSIGCTYEIEILDYLKSP